MTQTGRPVIRPVDGAPVIRAFGDEMILHLSSEDTGGRCTLWTNVTPPGGGPPPHRHANEDEWFWPLSGPAEFLKDGDWVEVPAKTAVFMPRGSIHAFRNPNNEPLHMLIQTMPGGFDRFFRECSEQFSGDAPPDMGIIAAISERYGISYHEAG